MKKHSLTHAIALILGLNQLSAAENTRDLDLTCPYTVSAEGTPMTYRQLLTSAINYIPLNVEDREEIILAMTLFGKGKVAKEKLDENNYTSFRYGRYRVINDRFLAQLNNINLPFKPTEESLKTIYEPTVMFGFDVRYALKGIIGYHAYQSTGGNS